MKNKSDENQGNNNYTEWLRNCLDVCKDKGVSETVVSLFILQLKQNE